MFSISLIRIAFKMSMSNSEGVVAMSEQEEEDEIRHMERIIRSKPFPYGTVTHQRFDHVYTHTYNIQRP